MWNKSNIGRYIKLFLDKFSKGGNTRIGNECNWYKKRKAKACTQIMAPLTSNRSVMSLRAFDEVATDYARPFITIQGRGKRREKRKEISMSFNLPSY